MKAKKKKENNWEKASESLPAPPLQCFKCASWLMLNTIPWGCGYLLFKALGSEQLALAEIAAE